MVATAFPILIEVRSGSLSASDWFAYLRIKEGAS